MYNLKDPKNAKEAVKKYLIRFPEIGYGSVYEGGFQYTSPEIKGVKYYNAVENFLSDTDSEGKGFFLADDSTRGIRKACIYLFHENEVWIFDGYYAQGPIAILKDDGESINLSLSGWVHDHTFLESETEVEIYKCKEEISLLESDIQGDEYFLSDPWRDYEYKKADYQKKLNKVKCATEHRIKEVTEKLEINKKRLEGLKEKLIGFFTGNKK